MSFVMKDLIFINFHTGEPSKNGSYDKAETKRFCVHTLCHTYAIRALERDIQPKVLQQLLGHASRKAI